MQTPKASCRPNSSGVLERKSPRSISSEASRRASPQAASSEGSQKDSPQVIPQLKTSPRYLDPTASSTNQAKKAPKRAVLKCLIAGLPTAHFLRYTDSYESQISQLEHDLKVVKDHLCTSETSKKQALEDAKESNRQLLVLASELEKIQKTELGKLKENLAETLWVVEEMEQQVKDYKESEDRTNQIVGETLMQLEMAKKAVKMLRADGNKATEAYGALISELEKSRAHVNILEELVSNLKAEISCTGYKDFQKKEDCEYKIGIEEQRAEEAVETKFISVRLEVEQLRSALEVAEMKYNKEQARCAEEIRTAVEMLEQIKSASGQREAELEAELRKSKYEIEELKANLMDKETELQGICEENDDLLIRLENAVSRQREHELEKELQKLEAEIESMKARLTDKDTEWQNIVEENRTLKLEIRELSQMSNDAASNLGIARAAEREALMKVGYMMEETDKSNRKLGRVTEQLEAEQVAYAELEVELRKLKVQSDQWRKAAEAATSMLSAGNNGHLIERTGSMDSSYCPRTRRITSPYADKLDEELFKKRNANLLRRFEVLWKKPLQ